MQLYLIRHGQSYVNLEEWQHGNTDEGLTELGQQQAARLAAWLPTHLPHIDALYASTMRRARETAEAVAQPYGCPVQLDDRLRELGNNRLDHTAWPSAELPNRYAEYWSLRPFAPTMAGAEGAESVMHARTRVGLFVEEMAEKRRDQVVVAVTMAAWSSRSLRTCLTWGRGVAATYGTIIRLLRISNTSKPPASAPCGGCTIITGWNIWVAELRS